VDDHTPAEELPTLYRAVLDTVMRLEHVGDRAFAYKVRQDALHTYSTRWDDHGRVALRRLERRARERLANLPGADGHSSLVTSIESV
jgi:hypothetical protein